MSLDFYSMPGFVEDGLTAKDKRAWSNVVGEMMSPAKIGQPTPQFYDASRVKETGNVRENVRLSWSAFPQGVEIDYATPSDRWRAADSYRSKQDEYCEWSVQRAGDKITRVVFTTEGPEYFDCLAQKQPAALVRLYQEMNPGASVVEADLWENKNGTLQYNRSNKWNALQTDGPIMHLGQSNTIGALVNLAARATIIRKQPDGSIVENRDAFFLGAGLGLPLRNSDPYIASMINQHAQEGAMITLQDPVGVYINPSEGILWPLITTPDGSDPQKWCRFSRGKGDRFMRAEFQAPEGSEYTLGDIRVEGRRLQFGSQLAGLIRVDVYGRLYGNGPPASPQPCVRPLR